MNQDNLAQVVLEALDNEDPNVLRAACRMAGELELAQAERGLIKALGHKVHQVQAEAATALGRLGSQGAAPYLRRLLKASEGELRQKVLTAAAGKAQEVEGEAHPEVQRAAALAISRLSPAVAQDALMAALGADQPKLLEAAIAGLANLESTAGTERMMELLGSGQAEVRAAAAAGLGRLRHRPAAAKLVALLEDDSPKVRKEAVIALNHIKDRAALDGLVGSLDDDEAEVRRVAAIALGNTKLKDRSMVQGLIQALNDRDAAVRRAALSALANLRAADGLRAAAALLTDSHAEVARQAGVTVTVLGQAAERPDYDSAD